MASSIASVCHYTDANEGVSDGRRLFKPTSAPTKHDRRQDAMSLSGWSPMSSGTRITDSQR